MSAGIRFYTNNGALMIDSSYANIALVEKVNKPTSDRSGVVEGNNAYNYYYSGRQPILVLPLSENYYCGVYTARWNSSNNRFESIVVTSGNTPLDMLVFDKPTSVNTTGPALRVYSDIDGSKVFDSRLKYLKVVGTASDGMAVPAGAKWGLLMRERQLFITPVYVSPGTARGYLFVMLHCWDIYQNKLRKRQLVVYSEYFDNLASAPAYDVDPIRGVEPLIVDLKNY
ncbi:hypothetical protein ACQKCW_03720 [Psychrobacter pacificensis]|uniref:hypothetical protein n=1 Tax=Psychrobacter pacificensis TaxID=112002 RepID=UPI003D025160